MQVTLLPSALITAADAPQQYLTSYIIDDAVAIDAGSLGFYRGPREQARIRHLFLSHAHLDHIASLPIFLDNIVSLTPSPVTVHASEVVQEALRRDLFNNRVWPDFLNLAPKNAPFVLLNTLRDGEPVQVEGLRITPVPVSHAVPTHGFIIENSTTAIVIVSDTGPTTEIWERTNRTANVKAVFLEASFPSELSRLAQSSCHLTTSGFVDEIRKLRPPARIFAVHLKAPFREQILQELDAQGLPHVEVAQFGRTYEF